MITDLQFTLAAAWELLNYKFTIYGLELSFAEVFIWTSVAGLVLWFIGRLFDD